MRRIPAARDEPARRRRPRSLGEAVAAVRAETAPATLLAAVQEAWQRAAGERIAAEAKPVAERDGTVTVACHAATWAQELDLLQDELRARLNRELGAERVLALRFTATGSEG